MKTPCIYTTSESFSWSRFRSVFTNFGHELWICIPFQVCSLHFHGISQCIPHRVMKIPWKYIESAIKKIMAFSWPSSLIVISPHWRLLPQPTYSCILHYDISWLLIFWVCMKIKLLFFIVIFYFLFVFVLL